MARQIHVHIGKKRVRDSNLSDTQVHSTLKKAADAAGQCMRSCLEVEEELEGQEYQKLLKAMNLVRDAKRLLESI